MATQRLGRAPDSIGIDTWGVDYGLLDAHGELLRDPRAYRDRRMARWAADLDRALPEETAWQETGILPQQINTVYQLYADLRQEPDLITLASMLRIPVYMHNVERERILRPKAWVPFGTAEPESADFRACATFGPLYR